MSTTITAQILDDLLREVWVNVRAPDLDQNPEEQTRTRMALLKRLKTMAMLYQPGSLEFVAICRSQETLNKKLCPYGLAY